MTDEEKEDIEFSILELLYKVKDTTWKPLGDIQQELVTKYGRNQTAKVFSILQHNGAIDDNYINNVMEYHISGAGESRYQYLLLRREEKNIQKQLLKLNLETNQSVIDTNKSVFKTNTIQQKNIRWNNKLFWVTLGVALLGAIGTWADYFNGNEKSDLNRQIKAADSLQRQTERRLIQTENARTELQHQVDSLIHLLDTIKKASNK